MEQREKYHQPNYQKALVRRLGSDVSHTWLNVAKQCHVKYEKNIAEKEKTKKKERKQ